MQPASISFAICGLRRIIIVFSLFQTNKMEKMEKWENNRNVYFIKISTPIQIFVSLRLKQREIALVPRLPLFENCT